MKNVTVTLMVVLCLSMDPVFGSPKSFSSMQRRWARSLSEVKMMNVDLDFPSLRLSPVACSSFRSR